MTCLKLNSQVGAHFIEYFWSNFHVSVTVLSPRETQINQGRLDTEALVKRQQSIKI